MHAVLTVLGGLSATLGALALLAGVPLLCCHQGLAGPALTAGALGLVIGIPLLLAGLQLWSEVEREKERAL
ncbi:MAG: hypothetical protein AB7N76_06190 [Planctomycetota bacterium]